MDLKERIKVAMMTNDDWRDVDVRIALTYAELPQEYADDVDDIFISLTGYSLSTLILDEEVKEQLEIDWKRFNDW